MEEQLQELTAKLAAMETEKHSLATRNKVLETALATAKATPGQVRCHLLALRCPDYTTLIDACVHAGILSCHVRSGSLTDHSCQGHQLHPTAYCDCK